MKITDYELPSSLTLPVMMVSTCCLGGIFVKAGVSAGLCAALLGTLFLCVSHIDVVRFARYREQYKRFLRSTPSWDLAMALEADYLTMQTKEFVLAFLNTERPDWANRFNSIPVVQDTLSV